MSRICSTSCTLLCMDMLSSVLEASRLHAVHCVDFVCVVFCATSVATHRSSQTMSCPYICLFHYDYDKDNPCGMAVSPARDQGSCAQSLTAVGQVFQGKQCPFFWGRDGGEGERICIVAPVVSDGISL